MRGQHTSSLTSTFFALLIVTATGCAARQATTAPPPPAGKTTVMPASYYSTYYSTQKARSLGETYSSNLDGILNQLTQSSIGKLQFANAVVSLSVGFFTHAASQPPDERYLEALIGMPDILDEEKDFSAVVRQLFSQYGQELLSILTRDEIIANDANVAGYGMHFSWRSLLKTPSGPHLTMREAVLYFAKDQARQFLNQQITLDMILEHATLFSRQGERPAELVQYSSSTQPAKLPSPIVPEGQEFTPAPAAQEPQPSVDEDTPAPDSVVLQEVEQSPKPTIIKERAKTRKKMVKPRSTFSSRQGKRIIVRRPRHKATASAHFPQHGRPINRH